MAAPNLGEEEQMILDQFVAVSDWHGDMNQAVTLLQICDWNVELALSRFFDQGMPVFRNQEQQQQQHDIGGDSVLGDQLVDSLLHRGLTSENSPLAAPRIREANNSDFLASSWLSSIFTVILLPFNMVGRVISGITLAFSGLAPLLPYSLRASIRRISRPINSTRIALLSLLGLYGGTQAQIFSETASRDRALRFIHRVENYGLVRGENPDTQLGFYEGGYNQALDKAKREYKFLLVILLSFKHDDTQEFVTKTLLSPAFKEFIRDNSNNLVVWGGDVGDSEGYQVANGLLVTRLPMVGLIGLQQGSGTSARGATGSGMTLLRRFQGLISNPVTLVDECTAIIIQHSETTSTLRQQELEREQEREMRRQQDAAYEASLATDRARRIAQEEAKRKEQDKKQQQERQEQLEKEWISWRASQILPEPNTSEKGNYARVSIRTLNGDRIVRLFASDTPIEEIYAVVECANSFGLNNLPLSTSSSVCKPQEYQHKYKFHLVSPMPRTVINLSQRPIKDEPHLWPNGNLIVEDLDDDDDDDE